MDRRLMGVLVAAACLAGASLVFAHSSTSVQSNASGELGMAKGDAGGWNASLITGSGPEASKDAGVQVVSPASPAVGNAGGSAAPGDK